MFDFRRVRDVANVLYRMDGEEFDRSAISRYYYSLFGCCRLYLIIILGEYNFISGADIHKRICNRLKDSNNPTEHSLGTILDTLRQFRNLADYDWDKKDSDFFQEKLEYVKKESKVGLQQVEALKKSPPFKL